MILRLTDLAGIDGQAIILVINRSPRNDNSGTLADIKSISIMSSLAIAVRVINCDTVQSQVSGSVNAEYLNWRVLEVQSCDGRRCKIVCVEEFGLGRATVRALTVPPAGAVAIDNMSAGATNFDAGSRN